MVTHNRQICQGLTLVKNRIKCYNPKMLHKNVT